MITPSLLEPGDCIAIVSPSYHLDDEQFDAAITSLEAFSKIKNADTKEIMNSQAMIETHKKIYSYADKLRQLLDGHFLTLSEFTYL